MATIFRLDNSTLYMCDTCLVDLGPIPGTWREEPLDKCSICGDVDLQAQEEMHNWCHDQDQQAFEQDQRMWEDHIAPESYLGKTPGTSEWDEASQLRNLINEQELK